jgi:hypothetical protein
MAWSVPALTVGAVLAAGLTVMVTSAKLELGPSSAVRRSTYTSGMVKMDEVPNYDGF